MKIKTNELTGPALDWAVLEAKTNQTANFLNFLGSRQDGEHHYSTDWSQGGPIIEREGITIVRCDNDYETDDKGFCTDVPIPVWVATTGHHSLIRGYDEPEASYSQYESDVIYGPTPLVAAMRCFVASHLGDEVDVPEELL